MLAYSSPSRPRWVLYPWEQDANFRQKVNFNALLEDMWQERVCASCLGGLQTPSGCADPVPCLTRVGASLCICDACQVKSVLNDVMAKLFIYETLSSRLIFVANLMIPTADVSSHSPSSPFYVLYIF